MRIDITLYQNQKIKSSVLDIKLVGIYRQMTLYVQYMDGFTSEIGCIQHITNVNE